MMAGAGVKRSAGYSLITVLIATAIVSITLAAVLFIVDMVSTAIARSSATDQIESAIRTVQGMVSSRDLCDNALRMNSASQMVPFNPGNPATPNYEAPINRIYLQKEDNEPGSTAVLMRGGQVGVGYTVNNISLRERVAGQGRGTLTLGAVTYGTYAAEIVIDIFGGSGMRRRSIPYNAVVHPGGDNVLYSGDDYVFKCYQDSSVQYLCEQLGGTYVGGVCNGVLSDTEVNCKGQLEAAGVAGGDCPDDPVGIQCDDIYYVVGFTLNTPGENSRPICRCQKVCRAGTTISGGSTKATVTDATPAATPGASGVASSPGGGN